jgi:hypothetical protein
MAEKSVVRRPNYCKNTHQELPCEECGKIFTSVRRGHRFCSWECSRKYIRRTKPFVPKIVQCRLCKKCVIQKTVWQAFCSSSCRDKWYRNPEARNRSKKCLICKSDFLPKGKWSEACCSDECRLKRLANSSERYRSRNKLKGLCHSCSEKKLPNSSYLCEKHWFNRIASANGISGRNSGEIAKNLLEAQGYRCLYTGRALVPGLNASIDHIKPKSRFPNLISSVKNIEWVDFAVNIAKGDMTKEEFIDLCKSIASRF